MDTNCKHKKCILDIETTSFTPWEPGRIICIGIKDVESGAITVFHDKNEEALLIQFFQYFNKMNYREIIGYNISFDIRFIFSRCLLYKVPACNFFAITYVDLMMILKGVNKGYNFNQPGTLNEWSIFLFGKGKLFENTQVPLLYQQGRIQEIIEYNENDLELTYTLWKRIKVVLDGNSNN